ncbi:FHA domain-containing protein [Pontiellaceae bacterium B12227]|nr:FHA domain-containing protein [Pontiellaceae bacterium B12227]
MAKQTYWMLTIREGSTSSFVVMLSCGEKVVIGRSRTCEIILTDPAVSRKHCFLGVGEDGVLKLIDFGARHPAVLDGVSVQMGSAIPLQSGCQIRLGRSTFINVECVGEDLPGRINSVDLPGDGDLEHTHTSALEKTAPAVAEEAPETEQNNEPLNEDAAHSSEKRKPDHPEPGNNQVEVDPASFPERVEEVDPEPDAFDEKHIDDSDQEEKTSLVNKGKPVQEPRPENQDAQEKDEGDPIPAIGTSCEDEDADLDVEQETKQVVNNSGPSVKEVISRPPAADEANQNQTQVLGKTLQGKLILPKEKPPEPVSDNTRQNAGVDQDVNVDEVKMPSQPGGDEQDETCYVDPAELQKLQKTDKTLSEKNRKTAALPQQASEAGNIAPAAGGSDDETSYVDPVELQKLMKGKGRSAGKKSSAPKAMDDAPVDAEDETNYVDPAEIQKLMKAKAGLFGKKSGKKAILSNDRKDRVHAAPADADSGDETNYVDPAEIQKLMKAKTGLFGKRSRKKDMPRKGDDAVGASLPEGDSDDETSYIDPAELQKLMKKKTKSPGSKRGR